MNIGKKVFVRNFVLFEVYIPVNSYDHVEMVSSTNHTLFLGKLD